jgi:predicted HTH transcriptional regulator
MVWSPFRVKRSGKMVATRVGINSAIVETLESHNEDVSIGFVANEIGKSRTEIAPYIADLKRSGIIKQVGENVSLQSHGTM